AGVRAAGLPAGGVGCVGFSLPPARPPFPPARGAARARGCGAAGARGRRPRERLGAPVAAWAEATGDPARAARYKGARGKGGFVRSSWPEVSELIAAAHVHTVKE